MCMIYHWEKMQIKNHGDGQHAANRTPKLKTDSSAKCHQLGWETFNTLRYISWECKIVTIWKTFWHFFCKKQKFMCNVHQEFHYLVFPQEKRYVCLFTKTGAELFRIYKDYSKLETCRMSITGATQMNCGIFPQWRSSQSPRKRHGWASARPCLPKETHTDVSTWHTPTQHWTVQTDAYQQEAIGKARTAGGPPQREGETSRAGYRH